MSDLAAGVATLIAFGTFAYASSLIKRLFMQEKRDTRALSIRTFRAKAFYGNVFESCYACAFHSGVNLCKSRVRGLLSSRKNRKPIRDAALYAEESRDHVSACDHLFRHFRFSLPPPPPLLVWLIWLKWVNRGGRPVVTIRVVEISAYRLRSFAKQCASPARRIIARESLNLARAF